MSNYYVLDGRAWGDFGEGKSLVDSRATCLLTANSLKEAEKCLEDFPDSLIVDENFEYVHTKCYEKFWGK